MAQRSDLPDIRRLTEDPARDSGAVALRFVDAAFAVVALAALLLAASVAWDARLVSHFSDVFFAAFALACVGVPIAVTRAATRREGREIVILYAVIAPVVVWICVAIMLAVVGSLDGENVF
jgi:hypothetical protein